MRIGVISDTHGSVYAIENAIKAARTVDAWIHLGDYYRDANLLGNTGVQVYAVKGNCDLTEDAPAEAVIEMGEIRIFIAHGHTYQVKSTLKRLANRAEELYCGAALYGHTHRPAYEMIGSLKLLNPGSPSQPRGGGRQGTFAVLTIDKGLITGEILTL